MHPDVTVSTRPFERGDVDRSRLVVHFWASWNLIDRMMDANLQTAIEQFEGRVEFCSLNIDLPEFRDFCNQIKIANVPTLVFFKSGKVERLLVGVCEAEVIVNEIVNWLEKPPTVSRRGNVFARVWGFIVDRWHT